MAARHVIAFTAVLVLSVILGSLAKPGHIHTKHIIHAPLRIKMIHHHKIVKVPVVFRKHLHHHKYLSHEHVYVPLKEKPKPVYVEEEEDHHPVKVIDEYSGPYRGGDGGDDGGDHYPVEYVNPGKNHYDNDDDDSGEGNGYDGPGFHYKSRIGVSDRQQDYSSYDYDEAPEQSIRERNLPFSYVRARH